MSEDNNETQWFIARDGKQHGPLNDIEMRTFVAHNYLRATDLIWRPGMSEWLVATLVFPHVFQPATDPASIAATAAEPARPAASQHVAQNAAAARPSAYPEADHVPVYDRTDFAYPGEADARPRAKKRLVIAAATLAVLGGGAFAVTAFKEPLSAILAEVTGGDQTDDTVTINADVRAPASDGDAPPMTASADTSPSAAAQPIDDSFIPGIAVSLPPEPSSDGLTEFQTAALPPEPAVQTPPSIDGSKIDAQLQKIPAWASIKSQFPDWYTGHIAAAETLAAEQRPQSEIAQHLAQGLVTLRRQHADQALAASPAKLEKVAVAFLDNLSSLRTQSVSACYGFISKGEASPAVVQLMETPEAATTFHAQISAIFDAISEGAQAPHQKEAAVKADYDLLIKELGKLGWKEEDLQVFSNPRLLSQREPDEVCKMVQDWFVAHLAVEDQNARNRLLFETLKPVVSG
jgi:hypothetical protein